VPGRSVILLATGFLLVAGAVAAIIVLVVGGGGDSAPTRAEYIAQVNAVCAEHNAELARIPAPVAAANPDAIRQSIEQALPITEERAAEARAIEPPTALEPDVERMFSLSDEAIEELREARDAAQDGNLRESATALGRFLAASEQAHEIGLSIGLSC
jgi:hypothetical protein